MVCGNNKLLDTLNTEARRDRCLFFISRSGKRGTRVLSMAVSFSGKCVFYLFCEAHRSYVGLNFVTTGM